MYVRNSDYYLLAGAGDACLQLVRQWAEAAREAGADRVDVMEGLVDPQWIAQIDAWPDQSVFERFDSGAGAEFKDRWSKLTVPDRFRVSEAVNTEPRDVEWSQSKPPAQPGWLDFDPVYIHNTWIYLKHDMVEIAIEKINEEVRLAKKRELGILRFDVYRSIIFDNLVHTYEVYAEQDSHLFHYDQIYLKNLYNDVVLTMFDRVDETRGHEFRPILPDNDQWMGRQAG